MWELNIYVTAKGSNETVLWQTYTTCHVIMTSLSAQMFLQVEMLITV